MNIKKSKVQVKVKAFNIRKKILKNIFLLLIFSLAFSFFSLSRNIYAEPAMDLDTMEILTIPRYPGPNQEVSVSLNSHSFDINTVEITVLIDGKILDKKIGLKKFTFKTKGIGRSTNIIIKAKKISGKVHTEKLVITPADVDLVYELKNPYKPFGYLGKSTYLSNSELAIFAFPNIVDKNGRRIPKKSLVYTWSKNYEKEPAKSGFGKSTYTIKRLDAFPRETTISVRAATVDGLIVAKKSITFSPKRTNIEFYKLNPSLPFSFKNIANPNIFSNSLSTEIRVVPFFMDNIGDDKEFKYQWKIGGVDYTHPEGKDRNKILLVNNEDNFSREVEIYLQIKGKFRVLQSAEKSFKVFFSKSNLNGQSEVFYRKGSVEESSGTGLFGL